MKKFLYLLLLAGLPIVAAAQPITSVSNGTDLEMRSIGGSVAANIGPYSTTIALPPSTLAHIAKTAGTLTTSFNLTTLFPGIGLSTVVTATGSADTSTNEVTWTITDPTAAGTTFTVPYKGTNYTVKVTGISGSIVAAASLVKTPIYDSFDTAYRTETLEPPTTNTSTLTITGTTTIASSSVPVTLKFTPALAGVGGTPPGNFVKQVGFASSSILNDTSFTIKVALNEPAGTGGVTVNLSGLPFTVTSTVAFPAGAQEEFVTGSAPGVAVSTPGHIVASFNGYYCDMAMTDYPLLAGIAVLTTSPVGGAPVSMRVNLYTAAPTGGATVTLRCTDPNAVLPASVMVSAGSTFVDFTVYTKTPATATSSTGLSYIYITASYGLASVRTDIVVH